jgi:hypothetical protein
MSVNIDYIEKCFKYAVDQDEIRPTTSDIVTSKKCNKPLSSLQTSVSTDTRSRKGNIPM